MNKKIHSLALLVNLGIYGVFFKQACRWDIVQQGSEARDRFCGFRADAHTQFGGKTPDQSDAHSDSARAVHRAGPPLPDATHHPASYGIAGKPPPDYSA